MSQDLREELAAQTTTYEQRLIGAAVCSTDIAVRMVSVLKKEELYTQWIRHVFEAVRRIVSRDGKVNVDAVELELSRLPSLGQQEQGEIMARLCAVSEPASNDLAGALIEYVHELSFRRRVASVCMDMVNNTRDLSLPVDDWYTGFQTRIQTLDASRAVQEEHQFDLGDTVKRWALHHYKGEAKRIATGFPMLDNMLGGGFGHGELIILGGRPGQGKTTLAINFLQNIAIRDEVPSLFCTLEMSDVDVFDRLVCQESNLRPSEFNEYGYIGSVLSRYASMQDAQEGESTDRPRMKFVSPPLRLQTRSERIDQIEYAARRAARAVKAKYGKPLGFIVVDYLQRLRLLPEESMRNRNYDIGEIANRLKNLALELQCAVVVLSQLSRQIENGQNRTGDPRLSDLRDSGEIEAHADVVMFITSGKSGSGKRNSALATSDETDVRISVEKNRTNATGTIPMRFNGRRYYFRETGMPVPPIVPPDRQ